MIRSYLMKSCLISLQFNYISLYLIKMKLTYYESYEPEEVMEEPLWKIARFASGLLN